MSKRLSITPRGFKDSERSLDQRIFYWYRDEDGVRQPRKVGFYQAIWRLWPHTATDQDRADFVVECHRIITSARAISVETGGDLARLKPLADEARDLVHAIPESIPKNGFKTFDEIAYLTPLSAEEIEELLMCEVRRCDLMDWFDSVEVDE